MDLARQAEVVGRIRTDLENMTGTPHSRCAPTWAARRSSSARASSMQTHPALFVVEVMEKRDRTARASYQYVDVLTGTVELTHVESGENLLPWLN